MSRVMPRYQAIRTFLEEGIRQRRWKAGDRIPTEMELAAEFGVSRMTANKAIQSLVADGVLVRHQGMGTFVAEIRAESPLLDIRNIADEVRARGHRYGNRLLRLEQQAADPDTARQMAAKEGALVFFSEMVHLESGVPVQLEQRWVNPVFVPDYLEVDFTQSTPSQLLLERFPLPELEHVVEAVLPDERTAALLEIDPGEPCLQLRRRTWSRGSLISYARLIHPGSRYRLSSRVEAGPGGRGAQR